MIQPNAEIWHGDCLELLPRVPDASAAAVITDPPYCSRGYNECQKRNAKGQGLRSETIREVGWFINDNMGTAGLVWMLRRVAIEAARIVRDGGSVLIFTDWRMVPSIAPALESSGLRFTNLLTWDKGAPGLGTGFRPTHEKILHITKGRGRYFKKNAANVLRFPRVPARRRRHQTEKPEALLRALMDVVSEPGDLIIDPFAGSGSTGAAALAASRRFIGIEADRAFHAKALARLAECQAAG